MLKTSACRPWAFALPLVLTLTFAAPAWPASPSLGNVLPRGGQRGTELVLNFYGGRLTDAKEILCYSAGFTVTKLQVVNDAMVKATVKIAADCVLGEHAMRVRTATGISELRTFWVGALPNIDEKEPNSDFASPQKIPLNVTVNGVIDYEDVDYFVFEAKKGQRVTAEIEGLRLANTTFDPYVAILDMKRFELAASDDSPLLGQDGTASVIIPADGKYVVQVRDSAYAGNGACYYRLHVGTFPRPLAVVPAGGKMGEEVEVRFIGDPAGEVKRKIKLPARPQEKFSLFLQDAGGISPSGNPFRLSEFGNVIEVSPNDTHQRATPVPQLPIALNGVISKPGEIDHFRFKAKKGQTFDVQCYARRLGSPLDSVMTISYFGGGAIVSNDDAFGPDSYFRFTAPDDKEYVISVSDHLGQGGPTYFYRIEFTPVQARLSVGIPKIALYSQERQTISVPRGNRYATMVSASRANFGGEIMIGASGLPKGVTLSTENMANFLDVVPVLFEAESSAPVAGNLAELTGRHADPKQKISGGFDQSVELVIGQPGQSIYWRHDVHKAAVAVTEEVPFKIQIVEPKVPLVQNGSMNLKVIAERKTGYTQPITVQMLYNPPGVGSASSAVIPAGKNETVLAMNASGGAPVRKWKIAVLGTATVGNGPVWVSSQLANLEIAQPFVGFAMERAAAEQGKPTEMFCKVQQNKPFTGTAKVRLLGLPNKVTAMEMDITKDTKEIAFKVSLDKTSPPGQHNNIFCQVVIMQNGEPILHNVGGTQLRIDVPLPPKTNQPVKPPPMVVKKPDPPKPPTQKRLTRLEKLRLEQEEREKASKADPPKK